MHNNISHQQNHLLDDLETLSAEEQSIFLETLELCEFHLSKEVLNLQQTRETNSDVSPLPSELSTNLSLMNVIEKERLHKLGLSEINKGHVAVVIMAGGMGTRLGFEHPKGMYSIGLPSNKSLFQLHSEKVLALSRLVGSVGCLPLCIMTSPLNHTETVNYFKQHSYFGLPAESVHFFQQGTFPCFDSSGNVILESPGVISRSPDGNGGIFAALDKSGLLRTLTDQNVCSYFVMSVDNALALPAEPHFIGYCVEGKKKVANLCIEKVDPNESVGVVGLRDGLPHVIEYSELDDSQRHSTSDDGHLSFNCANVAMHYFHVDVISSVLSGKFSMPLHLAHKKIPYWDSSSKRTVKPTVPNGFKLETFIFDAFRAVDSITEFGCLVHSRAEIFAPVKNPAVEGQSDSAITARRMILDLHAQWVKSCCETNVDTSGCCIEVSPLVSLFGDVPMLPISGDGTYVIENVDNQIVINKC
ncbi:hypothetical protein P9112_012611 [Eukaryota sp. TZLM1-RC]